MAIKTYSFEDGKYEFDRGDDSDVLLGVRRNGVDWPQGRELYEFNKSFHAMLNKIDELEYLLTHLSDAVEALDGTSVENEAVVDLYRTWKAGKAV